MTSQTHQAEPEGGARLRKGERTRRQLIEVAATLFSRQGYAATTYDDLVEASGLSRGGFYFHFRTKEDLALAVIDSKQRQWQATLRARLERIESPGARLAEFGPTLTRIHAEDPSGWNLAMVTADMVRVPRLARAATEASRRWADYLAGIIADAQTEGSIRDDLDPVSLAGVLFFSMAGVRNLCNRFDDDDPSWSTAAHVRTWSAIVRQGLTPPSADAAEGEAGTAGTSGRPTPRAGD